MLHGTCVGEEAGARNLVFFRVKWLQAAMKRTSCVRRVRLRSFHRWIGSTSVFCNECMQQMRTKHATHEPGWGMAHASSIDKKGRIVYPWGNFRPASCGHYWYIVYYKLKCSSSTLVNSCHLGPSIRMLTPLVHIIQCKPFRLLAPAVPGPKKFVLGWWSKHGGQGPRIVWKTLLNYWSSV